MAAKDASVNERTTRAPNRSPGKVDPKVHREAGMQKQFPQDECYTHFARSLGTKSEQTDRSAGSLACKHHEFARARGTPAPFGLGAKAADKMQIV